MTTTAAPVIEDLLRDALDRLTRQEKRTGELEAIVSHLTPSAADTVFGFNPSSPTPPSVPWPPRRKRPDPAEARIAELEARLAAAEARVAEAARLELLGQLVGGVAHDFNNLLLVMSGNAEVLRELLPPDDPLRESADVIAATAYTAARVTKQLLTFSKPATHDPRPVDPNAAVIDAERVLRYLTGDRVELDFFLSPGVPPVLVDPGQFDQVLLNLVVNARDAIPGSGVITVRTATADVREDRPGWPAKCPPGEYVALTVSDTGCGMTEEVKARAFARCFTTKGANGSGIGLATVGDIVRGAGGHIEVESCPGWGTSVRVYWPPAGDPAPMRGEAVLRVLDR
jgi:signal transduction histidine kinase